MKLFLNWEINKITDEEIQYLSPRILYGWCRIIQLNGQWIWHLDQGEDGEVYSDEKGTNEGSFDTWELAAADFENKYKPYFKDKIL